MENKRLWAVMFVLLAFTLAGCTSTESMGSFWLGDDGEISHDEKPVPVPRGSGLVYTPDSRDREYVRILPVSFWSLQVNVVAKKTDKNEKSSF